MRGLGEVREVLLDGFDDVALIVSKHEERTSGFVRAGNDQVYRLEDIHNAVGLAAVEIIDEEEKLLMSDGLTVQPELAGELVDVADAAALIGGLEEMTETDPEGP